MKLCLGSASCVIENRLESEDSELERRLLRSRGGQGETAPHVIAPVPPPVSTFTAPTSTENHRSRAYTRNGSNTNATINRNDLSLSHTWHGGGVQRSGNPGTSDHENRGAGGGSGFGSRNNLRRPSKKWGTSKVPRDDDGGLTTPTGPGTPGCTGTPTKSVKFILGRKKTGSLTMSPPGAEAGAPDGSTSTGPELLVTASGKTGNSGVGKNGEKEEVDPRGSVMNVTVQARLWADYFNNTLRCWETLLDPFR